MTKPARSRTWPFAAILALLTLSLMAAAPKIIASGSAGLPLQPTSNSQTCFQDVNTALPQQPALSPAVATMLLQVAENSSQYRAFAQTGEPVSLVPGGPALEYGTTPQCAGITVEAYTFSFVSGGKELSIAVNPGTMKVVRTLTVPAVSW